MKNFINGLVAGIVLASALIANSVTSSSTAHANTTVPASHRDVLSVIVNDVPATSIPMAKASTVQVSKPSTSHRTVTNTSKSKGCYNYGMYAAGSDTVRICE